MLNALSILTGLLSLLIVSPSQSPYLGWGNWVALPVLVVGIVLGALSRSKGGRNFCLIVFAIACVRLVIGGGIV